jgi:ABC-2 type transport system ATP-binding protein
VLRASGLERRFGDRVALRDVTFSVAAGESLAVIGPNGAGKTTLLSLLGGVIAPTAGAVERGDEQRAIGWIPQRSAVYAKLTVAENLALFARLERVADPAAVVARMLEQTGLADRADDLVATLSGGNRQRVSIAAGLLADPAILLLDEPSSSLDPQQRERLWEFVGGLGRTGTAVLFTTHDVREAERHADRVLVLAGGELLFDGTPSVLHERAPGADFEAAFVEFLRAREPPAA